MSVRLAGFEPATYGLGNRSAEAQSDCSTMTSGGDELVLADCLALLERVSPDLALLAARWVKLPEPIRAGILAMVRASDRWPN
jgi:hypothetical protein